MKLYEYEKKIYGNGSVRNFYRFDPLKSCNELKGFLLSIQNKFGEVQDIIVKRNVSVREVLFYKRYNDLYDFLEEFDLSNIQKYNIYEFLCNNLHCKIDSEKNTIDIYRTNYICEQDSDNYEYYKFSSGLIVRYNNDNGRCYYLDKYNGWICDHSLQTLIDDAAYAYEIVDDPLKETSIDAVNHEYNVKREYLSEFFMEYCSDIEIIDL